MNRVLRFINSATLLALLSALALQTEITRAQDTVSRVRDIELTPLASVRLEALSETTQRPLFSISRRPQLKKTRQKPAKVSKAPIKRKEEIKKRPRNPFELVGVLKSENRSIALLRETKRNSYINGVEGDELQGWKIVSVGNADVLIENDGTRVQMIVFE